MKSITLMVMTWALGGVPALAADLSGTILDAEKRPVRGAFISAKSHGSPMTKFVVSDSNGRYTIADLFPGKYDLGATKPGFGDVVQADFLLSANGGRADFIARKTDLSPEQLPGNVWLADLPAGEFKARFVTGCTICHDIGAEPVRRERSREEWIAAIAMMRGGLDIYSVIPDLDNGELADWLLKHAFGKTPAKLPLAEAPENVVVTLYDVGDVDSWAHDMIIEPRTGAAWVGDYPYDKLIRVDPRTGAQKIYQLPVTGGGMHTLHFDEAGFLWITLQLTDMVARFDPITEAFRIYGGFQSGSLIHSFAYDEHGLIAFDAQGRMWLSEFGTNALASLHPDTGEVKEYALRGDAGHTYGVALDSKERVWFTKYNENTFGYLDPATGKVVEKEMPRPYSAPHRMDIDNQDRLWIPNSGYGTLAMYDIGSEVLREIPLPDPDTYPYSVRFDGATDTVWVTGNGANSLYRFDPRDETFTTFRLPVNQGYGRMIAIDYSSGDIWTALSNYPNKHTGRKTGTLVRLQHVPPPRRE